MDRTREGDLQHIREELSRTRDPRKRAELNAMASKIANTPAHVRAMREELLKAHRNGDTENIKDIHDYIKNKSQYANDGI